MLRRSLSTTRHREDGDVPKVKVGARAPAFALTDQRGKKVKLSDFKGKRVVAYFYPKADTPGCTTQSCALSDALPSLKKLKAVVVGISPDAPEKQKRFDEKYKLGFPLLADEDHAVAKQWGTWGQKTLYGRKFMGIIRSAFVIDEQGKVAAAYYKVSPKDTVPKVTASLQE
jgi:peroxiredoxin Q/BCP